MSKYRLLAIALLFVLWAVVPALYPRLRSDAIQLEVKRLGAGKSASYFVSGLLGQPTGSFQFILDNPALENDTIIMATYLNTGADFDRIYTEIARDVRDRGFKEVKVFAISVGCAVSYNVNLYGFRNCEIECYEINPCWSNHFLKPELQGMLPKVGLSVLRVFDFLLGPLKFVPIIPNSDEFFSIHLMTTQLQRILEETGLNIGGRKCTKAVVVSGEDEFLNNDAILDFYETTEVIRLGGIHHADTIGSAAAFASVFRHILAE